MKPPRVYVRGNRFYIQVYDPTTQSNRKIATGIEADIPAPLSTSNPSWWRKSKHARKLSKLVGELEVLRNRVAIGTAVFEPRRVIGPTFDTLIEEYAIMREEARDRPVAAKTREHWYISRDFLLRFKEDFELGDITREFVTAFRTWGKTQLKPKSLQGYWINYRAFFAFAERRKYIPYNHFRDYSISVPAKEPAQISEESVMRVLGFAFVKLRPLFDQLWGMLCTGIRVSNNADLKIEDVDRKTRTLTYLNTKSNRWEKFPLSEAYCMNFDRMSFDSAPYLYKYRDLKTVGYYLARACAFAGEPKISSHDLKRLYVQTVAKASPDARTFDLLAHHSPTVSQTAMAYYAGRDIELMRSAINAGQAHYIGIYKSFLEQVDDGKVYHFSNPKSHASKPQKRRVKTVPDTSKPTGN